MLQDAAHCEAVRDYVSREILEDILEGEEQHIDWLETQLGLIDAEGIQNWLQSHSGAPTWIEREDARNKKGQTEKRGLSLISLC